MSFRQQTMLLIMLDLKWQMKPLITPKCCLNWYNNCKKCKQYWRRCRLSWIIIPETTTEIMVEMTTVAVVVTRYSFGDYCTVGLMLHVITKGVIVAPRRKGTKIQTNPITAPMGAIAIVAIAKGKKCLMVWDRY